MNKICVKKISKTADVLKEIHCVTVQKKRVPTVFNISFHKSIFEQSIFGLLAFCFL